MWTFSSLDLAVKTKMFTQGLTATTSDSTRGSSASTHILAVQLASIQKTGGDLGLYQCSESVSIFYCQSGWQEKHSVVVRGSCLHEIWDEENLLNWRRRTAGDKLIRDCHAPTCSLVGWCLLRGYFNRIAKRLDIDSKSQDGFRRHCSVPTDVFRDAVESLNCTYVLDRRKYSLEPQIPFWIRWHQKMDERYCMQYSNSGRLESGLSMDSKDRPFLSQKEC